MVVSPGELPLEGFTARNRIDVYMYHQLKFGGTTSSSEGENRCVNSTLQSPCD